MAAFTRLSVDGYGARRNGSFAGRAASSSRPNYAAFTRLSVDGYGARRNGSFAGRAASTSRPNHAAFTRLSVDGYGARRNGSFSGRAQVNALTPQSGGAGRYIGGYIPLQEEYKKHVLKVVWTDDHEDELIALLKRIDEDFEKKRQEQFDELIIALRRALVDCTQLSISGYQYLSDLDMKRAKQKIQREEEDIMIMLAA